MAIEQSLVAFAPQRSASSSNASGHTLLAALSDLLHAHAEIFASPSTSTSNGQQEIHRETLKATKFLFDRSLKTEPQALKALGNLLADIRDGGSAAGDDEIIETRSRSSNKAAPSSSAKSKGKGRAVVLSNPLLRATPLQELYLGSYGNTTLSKQPNGTSASSNGDSSASPSIATAANANAHADTELELQMLWEQLEQRSDKVLGLYREIVKDGNESGDEEGSQGLEDDSEEDMYGAEEDEFGLEDDEEDEEMMLDGEEESEEDDEEAEFDSEMDSLEEDEDGESEGTDDNDDPRPKSRKTQKPSKPYFAQLRDADAEQEASDQEKLAATWDQLDRDIAQKQGKGSKKRDKSSSASVSSKVKTERSSNGLDDGFFGLKDFNSEVLNGEDEMTRYMRSGKSKSINDLRPGIDGLEDMDDSENEDVDYFAADPAATLDSDDDVDEEDDDEEEGMGDDDEDAVNGVRPEDMRYSDFWEAPSKLYAKRGSEDDYDDAPSSRKAAAGKEKGKRLSKREYQAKKEQEKKDARAKRGDFSGAHKGKGADADAPAGESAVADESDESPAADNAAEKDKKKSRRVSFNDKVKVQEFESEGTGKKSAFAMLVKQLGMKEAMRRISSGEVDEEALDDEEDDDEEEEEEEDIDVDGMTEDEIRAMLEEGTEGSEDEEEEGSDEEDEEGSEQDDDDDEEMSSVGDGEVDARTKAGAMTMRRLQKDLLEEDNSDDETNSSSTLSKKQRKGAQSRHEARMAALSEQIAALEQENVAEREWTTRGEINSRARPQNSLLEEDLEFDQAAKVVPVVTEESSLTLEELIKKRIIDEQFDDVIRKQAVEAAPYLPSRLLDIKSTQSDRSLADIYADEFASERIRSAGGDAEMPEVDAKLAKEHDSIRLIFDDVCTKLDALSNAHFTPKAAQTSITTLSNTPAISLESALPSTMSTSTTFAPEEVYAPAMRDTPATRSEMTPSQKKAARTKARKARMVQQKVIEKYSGKSRADKQAKDRAMNSLIGKRGVTVVGKGKATKSALTGKERTERPNPSAGLKSSTFKL